MYNSDRLTLSFVLSAARAGAMVANFVEAVGFVVTGDRVRGIVARDALARRDEFEIRARALASGWQIGQEGDTPRGPFIYFLNEGHPGTIVEMAEATSTRMRIFDQVREAALDWDGSDPIRLNWPRRSMR